MKTHLRQVIADPHLRTGDAPEVSNIDRKASILAVILGALGAALYSLKAIFVKLAYLPVDGLAVNELPAITLVTLRMGFAFPFYLAILWWAWRRAKARPTLRQIGLAMLTGLLPYYTCALLDFTGLQYITAQLERLLLFTYPAFVILFGALFFGGSISRFGIVAVLLAYGGLAIVFMGGEMTVSSNLWLGSSLIIACAIIFAMFQLLAKHFIDEIGPSLFTCLSMIGGASAIFVHFTVSALARGGIAQALSIPPRIYVIAAMIALFSTIMPSFCISYAIGKIGAQKVAMLGMAGPLATIAAAIFILGEPFGVWDAAGTFVTASGIALYLRADKSKRA